MLRSFRQVFKSNRTPMAAVMVIVLLGLVAYLAPTGGGVTSDTVVARVYGREVLMRDLAEHMQELFQRYGKQASPETLKPFIQSQALRDLVNQRLMEELAERHHVVVTDEEVGARLRAFLRQYPMLLDPKGNLKTTADLVGRYLIVGEETVWLDGPLTAAVRAGAICYLDEIVEARKDTTVVIHPLTDSRRALPVEKRGEYIEAPPDFMLVISYNPGYQSVLKEMKPSTRQRFVALDFDYPDAETEARIVAHEGGVDAEMAKKLVKLGSLTRKLKGAGLDEGAGTRLLVHAAQLIARGMDAESACTAAVARPLADEADTRDALDDLIRAVF